MRKRGQVVVWAALAACAAAGGPKAWAGTSYSSITDGNWFNATNWGGNPSTASDADIFSGQGFDNLTPDGVVYDPVNDPSAATNPTFSTLAGQLYLGGGSGSATLANDAGKLTVKSGSGATALTVGGTTGLIIGRPQTSGSSNTSEQAALVMAGGTVTLTAGSIDLSSSNSTAAALALNQNNTLDYTNTATVNATAKNGSGLRMDPVNMAATATYNSTLVLRHVAGGTGSINFASVILGADSGIAGTANNTVEFHYGGGGVDTVNVGNGLAGNSLKIANIASTTASSGGAGGGKINSFLNLVLDEAPALTPDGRAPDLGLFMLDDSVTGTTANTQAVNTTDPTKEFKFIDGTSLTEGAIVSSTFGGQTYNWNLYYDGNINGSTITGQGTGNDVVLIGQVAATTPEPASVGLIAMGGLLALGRRKRRA
jgi:hypothetical protein